ncbi:MAG: CDP-glycerol glycerophosphotransferase family protein [Lachnospiraceae bacterium]|nr:CDP-glycerol glycerophosphotransferase family protein [Lachnospiraceae bacterium]
MSILSKVKEIAKKSSFLRVLARNTVYGVQKMEYRSHGKKYNIDEKLVVFSAYDGRNYACSPKAVYEYMLGRDEFLDYNFIWLFADPQKHKYLEENRNTKVISNRGAECEAYLHQAKYWIFNFRAVDYWLPTKEQVYVQCWHGTPLKRLGYDITNSDNAMNSVGEIQSKYRTDAARFKYMVSPCQYVTEKFTSAWNLKETGKQDAILEIGYPRNDFLCKYTEEDIMRVKKNLGIENVQKKILLYAPTWRDNQHDASKGYVYKNPVDFKYLQEKLGDEYIILFRAHYLVANSFDFSMYKDFLYDVSSYDDINELYIISDMLITDYSSVFFDYAILERPMLFYMYDMEEYRDEMRGFYLDVSELPGPIVTDEKSLVSEISGAQEHGIDRENVKEFNKKFNLKNDGNAAERLVQIIF